MEWTKMNGIQKLMVMSDFFNESFPPEDCLDQIQSFIEKRDEDTDGDYVAQLKRLDRDVAGQWRASLKRALRDLDEITDWGGKKAKEGGGSSKAGVARRTKR